MWQWEIHIPTTKYATINAAQKVHKNIFEPLFYKPVHKKGKPMNLFTCLLLNKAVTR